VALLFLVKDVIPTEPIWTAFIAAAAELRLRTVPPPTPHAPPDWLPEVPLLAKELAAVCWKHSKQAFFAGGSGRPPFLGAQAASAVLWKYGASLRQELNTLIALALQAKAAPELLKLEPVSNLSAEQHACRSCTGGRDQHDRMAPEKL
jgi:hypothetical protein